MRSVALYLRALPAEARPKDHRYFAEDMEGEVYVIERDPFGPVVPVVPEPVPVEIDTAVNGTRVRCEDVTFGCSRLQNVIPLFTLSVK